MTRVDGRAYDAHSCGAALRNACRSWRGSPALRTLTLLCASLVSCGDRTERATPERRGAVPPSATTPPTSGGACTTSISDPPTQKLAPAAVGAFCVEGASPAYGKDAPSPIRGICDVFDGECEIYLQLGVEREVELRYVSGAASIAVHLSKFDSPDHAYAMFTKRIVGDGDPALDSTPRPLALSDSPAPSEGDRTSHLSLGSAALGLGSAVVVRGPYMAEMTFDDPNAAQAALARAADATLPALVRDVAARLPGADAPLSVAALPVSERLPMGVRFMATDLFGLKDTGDGAFGYHKTSGGLRYRSLVATRASVDRANLTLHALSRAGSVVPNLGDDAVRTEIVEGPLHLEWIFARKGNTVVGIGDEPRVLRDGMPASERAALCLPLDEKKARVGAEVAAARAAR